MRRKKINTEAKLRILKEWKELPEVAKEFSEASVMEGEGEETEVKEGQSRNKSKVKEVPDFKALQRQFAESLDKKKQTFKPTVPVSFNFTSIHHNK